MSDIVRGFFAKSWISRRSVGVAPNASSRLSMISASSPATRPSAQATHTRPLMIAKFCSCIVRDVASHERRLPEKGPPAKYPMTTNHYVARKRALGVRFSALLAISGVWSGCTAQAVQGDPPPPVLDDSGGEGATASL